MKGYSLQHWTLSKVSKLVDYAQVELKHGGVVELIADFRSEQDYLCECNFMMCAI